MLVNFASFDAIRGGYDSAVDVVFVRNDNAAAVNK
jgi:hypothetical protein